MGGGGVWGGGGEVILDVSVPRIVRTRATADYRLARIVSCRRGWLSRINRTQERLGFRGEGNPQRSPSPFPITDNAAAYPSGIGTASPIHLASFVRDGTPPASVTKR